MSLNVPIFVPKIIGKNERKKETMKFPPPPPPVSSLFSTLTAESGDGDGLRAVHIVHVKQSVGQEEPEAYHFRFLLFSASSEKAAKYALVYHYKHAARGFSPKLTPKQASDLSKLLGVLLVSQSVKIHLHSGTWQYPQDGCSPIGVQGKE